MKRGNYRKQRECGCSEDCGRRIQRWNWKQDGEAVSAVELCTEGVSGKLTLVTPNKIIPVKT